MKIDIKKLDFAIIVFLIILTIFRVGLTLRNPTHIFQREGYDDNLLYEYADSLIHGEWLGEYNSNTMAKRISYPLFIAICYELMIPYSLGYAILNIISAIFICLALKPKIDKKYLYIIYVLLLFSPVGFTTLISQRTYRNSILPFTVLLTFAGFIGLYLRRNEPWKKLIPWTILASLALPFFWNIKEDSIWILPFILVISACAIINLIIYNKKDIIKKTFLFTIPFIFIIITNLIISLFNYTNYGLFTTSDKAGMEFGKMMTYLYSIKDDNKPDTVWISSKMIQNACNASPTFKELEKDLKEDPAWLDDEDVASEVKGDWMVWRVRYIMTKHGYYESAIKANDFCKKVNQELEQTFKNGSLEKDNSIHIVSQMKGLELSEMFNFIPKAIDQMIYVNEYNDCSLNLDSANSGDQKAIDYINSVLGIRTRNAGENQEVSHRSEKFSNAIDSVYRHLSPWITIIACLGYASYTIVMIINMFKKDFEKLNLWLISTGIILSAFVACLEVVLFMSFFTNDMFTTFRGFYASGVYPLMQLAKYINIYMIYVLIKEFIDKRKSKPIDENKSKQKANKTK